MPQICNDLINMCFITGMKEVALSAELCQHSSPAVRLLSLIVLVLIHIYEHLMINHPQVACQALNMLGLFVNIYTRLSVYIGPILQDSALITFTMNGFIFKSLKCQKIVIFR